VPASQAAEKLTEGQPPSAVQRAKPAVRICYYGLTN
jgi:hypothetical protein